MAVPIVTDYLLDWREAQNCNQKWRENLMWLENGLCFRSPPQTNAPPHRTPSEPLKPARIMTKTDIINLLGTSSDEDDETVLTDDNYRWDEWESTFKRADKTSDIGAKRLVEHAGKCGYISLRNQLDEKCELDKFIVGVKREVDRCCEHYKKTGESYFVSSSGKIKGGRTWTAERDHKELKEHCNIPTTKNTKFQEEYWIKEGFFKATVKKYERTV